MKKQKYTEKHRMALKSSGILFWCFGLSCCLIKFTLFPIKRNEKKEILLISSNKKILYPLGKTGNVNEEDVYLNLCNRRCAQLFA